VFEPGHVTGRKPPFRYAVYTRVAFSDTDAQGVVYYGRYLPYFDLARTEYHRHLDKIDCGARSEFVQRASEVEYHAPARFDDLLEVFVRIAHIGRTSVRYEFEAYRLDGGSDDTLMVTAKQTSVLIDPDDRRTLLVPDSFRSAVSAFEGVEL
jgi:acyl-CoA thioester hydrolase